MACARRRLQLLLLQWHELHPADGSHCAVVTAVHERVVRSGSASVLFDTRRLQLADIQELPD
jgi:hypothetical protein